MTDPERLATLATRLEYTTATMTYLRSISQAALDHNHERLVRTTTALRKQLADLSEVLALADRVIAASQLTPLIPS